MTEPSGIEPNSSLVDSSMADPDDRDALIVRLLDEVTAQAGMAESRFRMLARRHPDLVDEVRMLWATAMVAEDFASVSQVLDSVERRRERTESAADVRAPAARFGDYEILEEIGRGGMGVVFRAPANQPGTDRRRAQDDPSRRTGLRGRPGAVSRRG